MAVGAGEIKPYICIGQGNRLFRTVDRINHVRTAPEGIHRESAGVAEHVEHTAPGAVALQQFAVVALVEEETCFLPAQPVDIEPQGVFGSYRCLETADDIIILRVEMGFIRKRGFRLIIHVTHPQPRKAHYGVGY